MKIGFIQTNPIFGEREKNLARTIELIEESSEANLVVLPELCTTGYLFEDISELQRLGEKIPDGSSIRAWEKAAKETDTYLVAGICEKALDSKFYNSAVLIGPDGFIDVYRKIHLFNTEKNFFTPGNGPLKIYDIGLAKIGIIICFDWIFPEITRILALNGAEIICHPANLVLPYAQKTMLGRSIENRIFTITANRIGEDIRPESRVQFTGMSQITSPKMELLAQSSEEKEEVQIVEIDPSVARNKMVTSLNHIFIDRRVDLYKPILKDFTKDK
ncbi:MAG TPA: nitrilase-related carbon-nitrogen hydrolase [Candidatus Bathyarchaeia archaeon]|nr:nitrilase-related carbon-nitrogen hydrolase [Candidatus Bathyarchaeia archaeon]